MSYTPPRAIRSAVHQASLQDGSPVAGPSRSHTTPAKNVNYSPSANLSPGISNLKKHSLYGIEDRVVIDPGSRIWKVGFSGEARPRKVFWASTPDQLDTTQEGEMWGLDLEAMADQMNMEFAFTTTDESQRIETPVKYVEVLRVIKARLTTALRKVYANDLLTESRSRKVIIVENALLPNPIKRLISEVLFNNLKVPSISFTSGQMLTLMATGNTTGLVVDFGYHDTTVVPVYQSRVMYQYLQTTPIAGKAFLHRLKRLIVAFGSYTPPRQSRRPVRPDPKRTPTQPAVSDTDPEASSAAETVPVPESVLDWLTLEDIRSRGCFVGDIPAHPTDRPDDVDNLREYGEIFRQSTNAKDATFILRKETSALDISPRSVKVPGWVRERAAEVFFETGDVDSASVIEVILSCLAAVPMDMRRVMASSIVVSGGACMMPGFVPRLRKQLLQTVLQNAEDSEDDGSMAGPTSLPSEGLPTPNAYQREQCRRLVRKTKAQHKRPFRSLVPLATSLAILNDTDPPVDDNGNPRAGSAPPFNPGLLPWIGGSIAGALQVGSQEVLREPADSLLPKPSSHTRKQEPKVPVWSESSGASIPDWTRNIMQTVSI